MRKQGQNKRGGTILCALARTVIERHRQPQDKISIITFKISSPLRCGNLQPQELSNTVCYKNTLKILSPAHVAQ